MNLDLYQIYTVKLYSKQLAKALGTYMFINVFGIFKISIATRCMEKDFKLIKVLF